MAPSHVRFGTFEIFYYRKQHEQLKILADYVIAHHYPHLAGAANKYARFFEIVERTPADRSMASRGLGARGHEHRQYVDSRPPRWTMGHAAMDDYDADSSAITDHSRYFSSSPNIRLWNLSCAAQALLAKDAKAALELSAAA